MNKLRALLLVGIMMLLAACGNASVDVEMTKPPEPETMSTVLISITDDGEAITDFEGTAEFRMVDMDHGSEITDLMHTEEGLYEGEVNLPMPGKWTIDIVGDSDNEGSIDTTIEVEL